MTQLTELNRTYTTCPSRKLIKLQQTWNMSKFQHYNQQLLILQTTCAALSISLSLSLLQRNTKKLQGHRQPLCIACVSDHQHSQGLTLLRPVGSMSQDVPRCPKSRSENSESSKSELRCQRMSTWYAYVVRNFMSSPVWRFTPYWTQE